MQTVIQFIKSLRKLLQFVVNLQFAQQRKPPPADALLLT